MTPSQRIKLIQDLLNKLSLANWNVIAIIFRQFSLPRDHTHYEEKELYILSAIEDAPDEILLGLAEHLQVQVNERLTKSPDFWLPGHFRLFLSHVSSFKEQAMKLSTSLGKFHISGFVAHESIEPTLEWQSEIEVALMTMDALVALITPDFHESKWTDQEIGFALGRNILVIPVCIGVDPYGFIGKHQGLKAKGKKPSEVAEMIYSILVKHDLTKQKMAELLDDIQITDF